MMWKAIGWNGEPTEESSQVPSDLEFKIHFEDLLNPSNLVESEPVQFNVHIPLLDDAIEPEKTEKASKSLHANKSYISVNIGFIKVLPGEWIFN